MPVFNRAIALVSLPSSNIILGFVFGDDFCTDRHYKHTNSSQSSSQLSAGKDYFKYCHWTEMDTWRKFREDSLLPTLPYH